MKKVVLFFPETHRQRNQDPWHLPPLSLLAIASPLVRDGFEVKIVDARVDPVFIRTIMTEIDNAICLGISVLTGQQIQGALQVSREVKNNLPGIPIVWGGYHPTLLPEQTIVDPAIDIVVKGQGEVTFRELIEAISQGRQLHDIHGLLFKENGQVIATPDRPLVDINRFPPFAYHLVDMEFHFPDLEFGRRTVAYVSSQGCPHGCEFCAESSAYGKRWSGLASRRVGEDLELLVKQYAADGIIFVDNNFFADEARVRSICTEIIERRLKFSWGAQGRTDRIARLSDETFDLLKKSGFTVFHTGAESGSDLQLAQVSKSIDRQTTLSCARICKEHGIRVSFGFIFGFPEETESDIRANFSLMEEVTDIQGEYDCIYHFYAPRPGSEPSETAVRRGAVSPRCLEGWINYNTVRGITPWVDSHYIDRIRRRCDYYYPFARPSKVFRERMGRHFSGKLFFRLVNLINKVRYRYRFFAAPIDWWFYNFFKQSRNRNNSTESGKTKGK